MIRRSISPSDSKRTAREVLRRSRRNGNEEDRLRSPLRRRRLHERGDGPRGPRGPRALPERGSRQLASRRILGGRLPRVLHRLLLALGTIVSTQNGGREASFDLLK